LIDSFIVAAVDAAADLIMQVKAWNK